MAPRKRNNGKKGKGRKRMNVTSRQRIRTRAPLNSLSNNGSIRRPLIQKVFTEAGSDFLGPLTVKASPATAANRILLSNSVSPSAFPGTRMTQLSNLWERYRFRRFKLRWVPAVPKTIACQLIVYQDTDPTDDPTIITNADALVRQATAQAGSQQFNFIHPKAINLAQRVDDKFYYTGVDKQNERFNRQGNFYVIQVTDPLDFNGAPLTTDIMAGSLYVDWICDFQIAQINPSAVVATRDGPPASGGISLDDISTVYPLGSTALGNLTVTEPTYLAVQNLGGTQDPSLSDVSAQVSLNSASLGRLSHNLDPDDTHSFDAEPSTLVPPGTYPLTMEIIGAPFTSQTDTIINWCNVNGTVPVLA